MELCSPLQAPYVDTLVASKSNNKVNRKDNKQISFRVSESEYLDLERSAKVLNMVLLRSLKIKRALSELQIS